MASSYVLKRIAAVVVLAASVGIVQIGLGTPAQAATWVRPTAGNITQGFNASSHKGVDIGAPYDTPIYAVHDGWVQQVVCQSSTGTCDSPGNPNGSGCGWYVGINHPDGTGTLYCHMIRRPLVNVGDTVYTGQLIGHVGSSGQSSGPHLHFQTHNGQSNTNANVVNPETYMSARGVNLRGGGGTQPPPPPPPGTYWVDTFASATGRSTPGGTATGTLYAGRNYVYCKMWGPLVTVGGSFNHWWLKTDLDSGNPWHNQWVSAYFLSRWGNDEAKDNNGNEIPICKFWADTFANATGRSTPGGTATGTLNAGHNYVYCRVWGPLVSIGGSYNHWWLKTDLDTGNPWQNQWVSAYYLSLWGNDEAKDNDGVDIPDCGWDNRWGTADAGAPPGCETIEGMQIVDAGLFAPAADGAADYVEQLRVPALDVGTYSIPAGGVDDQTPHREDEIYVVVRGRGSFTSGGETVEVGPGVTLYVPAGEEHRFHDITEDLAVLVFFAPAYSGRATD